ncbi:hypothetical protein ENTCAN_06035 [Enterobacter cancerogenus ATCC 35316]|nr:hypothetical protein ENTCAN_06035 [Enterobacter cancerogenus ATCC 35316]
MKAVPLSNLLPVCGVFFANGHFVLRLCNLNVLLTPFFYEIPHKNSLIE